MTDIFVSILPFFILDVIIFINFVWILIETIEISADDNRNATDYKTTWYSIIFVVSKYSTFYFFLSFRFLAALLLSSVF